MVPNNPADLASLGHTLYVAYAFTQSRSSTSFGYGMLIALDIATPDDPALLGVYDSPGETRGVHTADQRLYVADDDGGLLVLEPTGAQWPPTPTASATPSNTITPTPAPATPTATPTARDEGRHAVYLPRADKE